MLIRSSGKLLKYNGKLLTSLWDPNGADLALWLRFENDYTDSSGNGYDFSVLNGDFGDGKEGDYAYQNISVPAAKAVIYRAFDEDARYRYVNGMSISYCGWVNCVAAYSSFLHTIFSDGDWEAPILDGFIFRLKEENVAPAQTKFRFKLHSWEDYPTLEDLESGICNINTWYFYSLVLDGATVKLYINGSLVDSYDNTGFETSTDDFRIGGLTDAPSNVAMLFGLIDSFRIYDIALTATQILALYTLES